MKRVNNILLILIGAMILAFFVIFLPKLNRQKDKVEEFQQAIDSVKKVSQAIPDTIRDTTILTKWDTITRQTHDTVFYEKDTDTSKIYYDTLRNPRVRIWTASRVKGTMDWNSIAYQSRLPKREVILSEQVPTPYPVYREKKEDHLYITPQVGGSSYGPVYGVGAMLDREGINYSLNYLRVGGKNLFTIGTALKF